MEIAIIFIIAYILGSIPSGLWVGKAFYKKDIRNYGSGNLGATNTFRTLGKKAGIVVTLIDILKGTCATLIPLLFDQPDLMLVAGVFSVIGHIFPVFAGFKGGKAVATSSGVVLGYAPVLFVLVVLVFLIVLKLSKYVSLSSMAAALFGILYCLIFTNDLFLTIIVGVMSVFIVIRHKDNISRIKNKTEPKIKWM
ncbi:glycerol-3-phosphate 1-O-acyltransferase PlsY [Jeotgalibacillus haloalkalitolerans]|uniref:Glycerol-3-phosphate acyltransferase n=1 Tax=Jeotgalibacillus haloalkalitolerans TaxID=3104292 RepID=A0ABU5KKQ6_9BACL|nr:glycerol-3-phosphate 1-O-acyltransferase PlsY [Jeotgalibacillus sp. HH7-29]MDZ5711847.1 glycerol-3-phosphate 1-O-acyltransferase PlsY [Jeotgalibacillus sp. HH7-29]